MRVRMRTLASGPGGVLLPDHEYDLETEFATALCEGGYAMPAKRRRETATVSAVETGDLFEIPGVDAAIVREMVARGIGPETVAETADEVLLDISGLGPATLRKIRGWGKEEEMGEKEEGHPSVPQESEVGDG